MKLVGGPGNWVVKKHTCHLTKPRILQSHVLLTICQSTRNEINQSAYLHSWQVHTLPQDMVAAGIPQTTCCCLHCLGQGSMSMTSLLNHIQCMCSCLIRLGSVDSDSFGGIIAGLNDGKWGPNWIGLSWSFARDGIEPLMKWGDSGYNRVANWEWFRYSFSSK